MSEDLKNYKNIGRPMFLYWIDKKLKISNGLIFRIKNMSEAFLYIIRCEISSI